MHIHPSSPDSVSSQQSEESAAIKIQAGFRGYRVRKQLNHRHHHHHHQQNRTANGFLSHHRAGVFRRQQQLHHQHHHQQQHQQQQRFSNMDSNQANSNSTGHSVNGGAERIANATVDGSIEDRCATKIQAGVRGFLVRKKQKIASDAATKIQAGFRGFKARKEAQKLKQK